MMYKDLLVVCVKSKGEILREFKDEVFIPYNSNFSLFFKNLNSVRASVSVTLDGKPVFKNGSSLVVNANSEVEVERWVKDSEVGNSFLFVERTGKIESHRGIKAEDGIIRVSWHYEKVMPVYTPRYVPNYHINQPSWQRGGEFYGVTGVAQNTSDVGSSVLRGMHLNSVKASSARGVGGSSVGTTTMGSSAAIPTNEAGITVEGAKSNQKFKEVGWFPLESQEHVMVLRLLGDIGQHKVKEAVTVKANFLCGTCGTRNKTNAKFCRECGTAVGLELVA